MKTIVQTIFLVIIFMRKIKLTKILQILVGKSIASFLKVFSPKIYK